MRPKLIEFIDISKRFGGTLALKSVSLDIHHPLALEAVYRLADRADVFLSNYRESALERLGLGYETLSVRNPRLVYAVASGFGDKGPDANLGLWVRNDEAYEWLRATITTGSLRELLPETAELAIDRYELPNLRAVNFVLHGLLGDGVGGSTRFDPQAKALGELVRARVIDMPVELR